MEYHQSFPLTAIDEYKAFFRANGYVVIENALSPSEVQDTLEEVWTHPANLASNPNIKRDDPSTWEDSDWPTPGGGHGFLSPTDSYALCQAWLNRQKPEIVGVYQQILGEKEIHHKLDRFSVLRPTKNIKFKDGSVQNREEWKTLASWLHWDQNPWSEADVERVQGMLVLTDHTVTSGGFCCVPKFHTKFKDWGVEHPVDSVEGASINHHLIYVPKEDPIQSQVEKILMKAGSLLIWDSRLPHQNYPNDDDTFRIVQYLTFFPVSREQQKEIQQKLLLKIKCGLLTRLFLENLSDLGQTVFGLKRWDQEEGVNVDQALSECSESNLEALRLFRLAEEKEAEGLPMEAVRLFSRAYKLNPDLEEVVNWGS